MNEPICFVNRQPWCCLSGTWYTRAQGVGWKLVTTEPIPDERYHAPMRISQWQAYRGNFVENGLISEEQAEEIAKGLETEKPNPDELGLV